MALFHGQGSIWFPLEAKVLFLLYPMPELESRKKKSFMKHYCMWCLASFVSSNVFVAWYGFSQSCLLRNFCPFTNLFCSNRSLILFHIRCTDINTHFSIFHCFLCLSSGVVRLQTPQGVSKAQTNNCLIWKWLGCCSKILKSVAAWLKLSRTSVTITAFRIKIRAIKVAGT